ncbi:MAG: sigma-70 family RNA polymerase sigma factor [Treponema sp.]|jgi:RNA polymerase sigma-70 factor (ECF subfamily)|nr:sigma-70 family RNA polymerase sigma factor [Treponema sp.]
MGIDIRAFYEKYSTMVFRRCRRILGNDDDAQDAVQDVFVKLVKAEKSLHGQYPSSLLYTIATNTCLNLIRTKRRRRESSQDADELSLFCLDSGYGEVEAKMIVEDILKTESGLTRSICFMYHADGMTLREIGNSVGMSISGVRKRLLAFNTRARIKTGGGEAL